MALAANKRALRRFAFAKRELCEVRPASPSISKHEASASVPLVSTMWDARTSGGKKVAISHYPASPSISKHEASASVPLVSTMRRSY